MPELNQFLSWTARRFARLGVMHLLRDDVRMVKELSFGLDGRPDAGERTPSGPRVAREVPHLERVRERSGAHRTL